MQDSKIYEFFCALTGHQRRRFLVFLASPYFNQRVDLLRLAQYLADSLHAGCTPVREAAYSAAMGAENQPYDDAHLRTQQTFLLRLGEEFLRVERLQKGEAYLPFVLLERAYGDKNLPRHRAQNLQRWGEQIAASAAISSDFLAAKYAYLLAVQQANEGQERQAQRSLQPAVDALEGYFFAERLRMACELQAHEAVYKIEYDKSVLTWVVDYLHAPEGAKYLALPSVALHYYYYRAVEAARGGDATASEAFFVQFRALLQQHSAHLQEEQRRNLYRMAINYAVRRANADEQYARWLWEFYREALACGALWQAAGEISRFSYKNLVSLSTRLQEFDYARSFIEQYSPQLPKIYRRTYRAYALGKWYFAQKQYSEALAALRDVQEADDLFLALDVRVMLAKIYYGLKEWALMESFLMSFKTFVQRKKRLMGYHFENYKTIIRCSLSLLQLPADDKRRRRRLQRKIQRARLLTERAWLLDWLGV